MAVDSDASIDAQFDAIDWEELGEERPVVGRRTGGFLVALGLLALLFLYDRFTGYDLSIGAWYAPSRLDWLFVLSLVVFAFAIVVPAVRNRDRTMQYWRRFRRNRLAVACAAYLAVFFVLGTASLLVLDRPTTNIQYAKQPALFATVEAGTVAINCAGDVTGTAVQQYCHGSLQFPFGTNSVGQSVLELVVAGMGVSLLVALVTSMLMVPIATAVGTVAGYFGGWVDDVLMRYVDIQQTVPAFLVYIVLGFVFGQSLFLIVLVFGLLSWGGVARLVRSEVTQRREELYITAAESAGASRLQIIRRHILPNVSSTVLTATTRQIPLLILTEAAISFIVVLGDENVPSWGQMLTDLNMELWWVWAFPLAFLVITVFSFSVVGDALRDTLDPRGNA
ncbi:binding-protein-dependent transport system inner membrane protein [Halococcus morrhuae DSM 1307]|uniref:Binding-protein-dependent transport system inner membrane protein n=1 Tax=Halococcus morrhuae DSM 1307 TaxID=931277 RepID=M0N2N8_HALMO|nr:ABC transporter permease [Halococcus morrhuae]EMA51389.1 binding-protein-dependent transport system inner membrane protein [Halococcus morrhuae DSM 1307]